MSKNKGGRPKGSGNVFRDGDQDIHAINVALYGPVAYKVAQQRKAHINRKDSCHTCMKEVEDRLYGRPPQEIKHTGHKQAPLVLGVVRMGRVLVVGEEQPLALPEGAIEGELVDAGVETPSS